LNGNKLVEPELIENIKKFEEKQSKDS